MSLYTELQRQIEETDMVKTKWFSDRYLCMDTVLANQKVILEALAHLVSESMQKEKE